MLRCRPGGTTNVLITMALGACGSALAHPAVDRLGAGEIAGKVCTTRGGATFTFTADGHYSYDGMWADTGHYSVHEGAVTILLDSGLQRDFAVSKRDGMLYLEQTAVTCALQPKRSPRAGFPAHLQ